MKERKNRKKAENVPGGIVSNIPGAIFRCVCDEDWTMQFMGKTIEDIAGYPAQEFIDNRGRSYGSIIHPDDRDMVRTTVCGAIDGMRPYNLVYRILGSDGEIRWVNENGLCMFDENGRVRHIDGIIVDVTKQMLSLETLRKNEAALKEKSEELERYFALSLDLLCIANTNGEFVKVNPEWENLLGYSSAELNGKRFLDFVHPDDVGRTLEALAMLDAQKEILSFENRYRGKDGSYHWIEWRSRPMGSVIYAVARDITERKKAERYQNLSVELLAILNESADFGDSVRRVFSAIRKTTECDAVGIRLQDGDDYPYLYQDGFPDDFLRTENTLVERKPDGGLCHNPDGSISLECGCGLVISGATDPSNPLFTKGGSWWTNESTALLDVPAEDDPRHNPRNQCVYRGYESVALIPIHAGDRIVGLLQINGCRKGLFSIDAIHALEGISLHIGEALMRRQAEEKIRHMATHDGLTDLPSLRLAKDRLAMAVNLANRNKKMAGVMFLDLDGFKKVNDTCGHDAGDEVLREVAKRLRSGIRGTDTAARVGGDEFLLVITELQSAENAANIAQKIIQELSRPFRLRKGEASIGGSIGIALFPRDGVDGDSLIKLADEAMYSVKYSGKNGYAFAGDGKQPLPHEENLAG